MKSSAFKGIYANRRVLVTGDSGFKGAWLVAWLQKLGADVATVSLEPPSRPSLFELLGGGDGKRRQADICRPEVMRDLVSDFAPEIVFHLAAQALVRASYEDPAGTFATNVMGTVNVLEAVRAAKKPCAVVVCTSDKCYENRETSYAYSETDPMGGHDTYSASKGAAEIVTSSYRRSFFPTHKLAQHGVAVATVRAGNVIGPGDWARDRIVADCVRAVASNETILVRNPKASRPWQHVLEPLSGYLWLGAELLSPRAHEFADAWNFGPQADASRTVGELVGAFVTAWGAGKWEIASDAHAPHEAQLLQLSIEKATSRLAWRPVWPFETAIARTAKGYRALIGANVAAARQMVHAEIDAYTEEARTQKVAWAE